jgi:hypothetical protein
MKTVRVKCDRCKQEVEGTVDKVVTAGYYDVSEGYWRKFARQDERVVCDNCMYADPRYQETYGKWGIQRMD